MAKKNKGVKVPKRVIGIKVSKRTRRNVGHVIGLLDTPEAKSLLGSAIAAFAGAIAGRREAAHARVAGRKK